MKKTKKILSFVDSQNDCGAALFSDDELVCAVNEERIVRQKLVGGFPTKSINEALRNESINRKEIEKIVVGGILTPPWFARKFRKLQRIEYGVRKKNQNRLKNKISDIAQFKLFIHVTDPNSFYGKLQQKFMKKILKKDLPKELKEKEITLVDHHYAHAASAYYTQDKTEVLAVTADGCGDALSMTINACEHDKIRVLHKEKAINSYGWFYGLVTLFLGFQWHKHEGKVTGLAAYGNSKNIKAEFPFKISNNKIIYSKKWGENGLKYLRKELQGYKKEDVAAWLQENTEKHITQIVQYWVRKTKIYDVVLAGGLFANVKLNQKIHEIPEVKSVYIFPHMGDGGLAVGAGLAYLKPTPKPLKTVYLGRGYSDVEIKKALDKSGLKYEKHENIEKEIAKLLAKGKVIARFNGRMEYGPRALGNRSILYQTNDPTVNDWLNKKLKRTEFMPFAPATIWEKRHEYYKGLKGAENAARYMTITFNCTKKMKEQSPGCVHVDGTARPQLVKKEDNKSFYKIINEYCKITGTPSIINTSFNMHEEPIVMTPEDAIRAYKQSKLDSLAIGNYLA